MTLKFIVIMFWFIIGCVLNYPLLYYIQCIFNVVTAEYKFDFPGSLVHCYESAIMFCFPRDWYVRSA